MISHEYNVNNNYIITFDGPDACGKTTLTELLDRKLEDHGLKVVRCQFPGSSDIGQGIRKLFKSSEYNPCVGAERFLLAADLSQWINEVYLKHSNTVFICDRWWPITDIFYQKNQEAYEIFMDLISMSTLKIPKSDYHFHIHAPWDLLKFRMENDPKRKFAGQHKAQGYNDKHRCRIEDRDDLKSICEKYSELKNLKNLHALMNEKHKSNYPYSLLRTLDGSLKPKELLEKVMTTLLNDSKFEGLYNVFDKNKYKFKTGDYVKVNGFGIGSVGLKKRRHRKTTR